MLHRLRDDLLARVRGLVPDPNPAPPFSARCVFASGALLLAALASMLVRRSPDARELTRPWLSGTRVASDKARLADGSMVSLAPSSSWGDTLLVVIEDSSGVAYRENVHLRATSVLSGTLASLRASVLSAQRRRWATVLLLSLAALLSLVAALLGSTPSG